MEKINWNEVFAVTALASTALAALFFIYQFTR